MVVDVTGGLRTDRTIPLNQAAEAHRLISTNRVTGNIVLLPWAA